MIIETKFNKGDTVFYLDTDSKPMPKIKTMIVDKILILESNKLHIWYNGWETEDWEAIPEKLKEENVFATKEELLNSL